jgi:hypothetical protein
MTLYLAARSAAQQSSKNLTQNAKGKQTNRRFTQIYADIIAECSLVEVRLVRRSPAAAGGAMGRLVLHSCGDGGTTEEVGTIEIKITSGIGEKNFTTKTRRSRRGENSEFVRLKRVPTPPATMSRF